MKTINLFPTLFLMSIIFWSCESQESLVPSNNVTSKTYQVTDFNKLDVSGVYEVYVGFTTGSPSLRIEANDNLHAATEVEQKNSKLTIGIKDNTQIKGGQFTMKVYLEVKSLKDLISTGATKVYLKDTWEESEIEIELTGASTISGGVICNKLDAELTGASEADLFGIADFIAVKAIGASVFENFDMISKELSADLTGASEISLTVNENLKVKASGASMVYYKGNGVVEEQDLSGGSKIIKAE